MSVINTNITSMIAQKNLNASRGSLTTSMERLSSGMRINSAKDDAAGQAIANRMSAQIKGLAQAQRNANDGISVAQTAEGALNQVNDNLQRVRELTVQAQNSTNSGADLNSIQAEISQRLEEINRISEQTDFNGVKVLSKNQDLTIQVGANDGEAIKVSLKKIDASTLFSGSTGFNVDGYVGASPASVSTAAAFNLSSTDFAASPSSATFNSLLSAAVSASGLLPSGFTSASLVADDDGNLFLKAKAANSALGSGDFYFTASFRVTRDDDTGLVSGITVTAGNQVEGQRTESPLAALDAALNEVDSLRSNLGAIQNRFMDAITNLGTNETNLSAARSRIQDADYAVEVANMTRAQILQQAGTSVLAQANQIPQNVLSLLG